MDKQLIGAAGEHLVLSRLLSRGMLAAQAPRGTRKVDVLVNHLDGKRPSLIQVKTCTGTGPDGAWHMSEKHELVRDDDLFYCFVNFWGDSPSVHVVPAFRVADAVKESHEVWLATPGIKGQAHNDSSMRWIRNDYRQELTTSPPGWMNEYLEAWETIL
jgi:hypothetical protein